MIKSDNWLAKPPEVRLSVRSLASTSASKQVQLQKHLSEKKARSAGTPNFQVNQVEEVRRSTPDKSTRNRRRQLF